MAKAKKTLTAQQLANWKERSQAVALATGKSNQITRVAKGYVAAQRLISNGTTQYQPEVDEEPSESYSSRGKSRKS